MSRILFLVLIVSLLPARGADVAGVRIDEKASVANAQLGLTGAGLRTKLFFDVYVIGLYVADPKSDPFTQPGPKRVAIRMLRNASAAQFTEALVEGIRENHSAAELRALEARVQVLVAAMAEVKQAEKGMNITLDWDGAVTRLGIDGKTVGSVIEGADFYRALLRIWIGEHPVQEDLKKALLGAGE